MLKLEYLFQTTVRSLKTAFQTFKEGITYTMQYEDYKKYYSSMNASDYLKGVDKAEYPQKIKFEFGDDFIILTNLNSNYNEVFRQVFKGAFSYDKDGSLTAASLSEGIKVYHERDYGDDQYGYRVKPKSEIKITDTSSFLDFSKASEKLFHYRNTKDDYEIYNGDYNVLKGDGKSNILRGQFSSFFSSGWHINPFKSNMINDQSNQSSASASSAEDIASKETNTNNLESHEILSPTIESWTYKKSQYELHKTPKSFNAANQAAIDAGGHLAEIDNAEENNALFKEVTRLVNASEFSSTTSRDGGGSAYVWIGGTDQASEGDWKWTNSGNTIALSRSEWGSGARGNEPDGGSFQNGLGLGLENWPKGSSNGAGYGNAGSWNDINTSSTLFYIVEKASETTIPTKEAEIDETTQNTFTITAPNKFVKYHPKK